ncbi:leucine-rich repeat serine/threonine-protein kinase 2 [Ciona intestinalis]
MDEVLRILHNPNEDQEIVTACNAAISIIQDTAKRLKSPLKKNTRRFDEHQTANCFMVVFLSNFSNRPIIISITDAFVQLVNAFPKLKSKIGEKGLFFNLMELSQQNQSQPDNSFLLCALQLAVALTEGCTSNLKYCMEAGIISLVPLTFQTSSSSKNEVNLCIQLLAILLTDPNDSIQEEDVHKYRNIWLNQISHDKVDGNPISGCILDAMNRFLLDGVELQLNGIKVLLEFINLDGSMEQLRDHGTLDTTLHACCQYEDDVSMLEHGFRLMRILMLCVTETEIEPRLETMFHLISSTLEKHLNLCSVMEQLVLVLMHCLNISLPPPTTQLPSRLFHSIICYFYASSEPRTLESLCRCLVSILTNVDGVTRNQMLVESTRNSDVNFMICLIYYGGNINYTVDGESPLLISCRNRNTTQVVRLITMVTHLHEVGLWRMRIENITESLKTAAHNEDQAIMEALLWYLVYRDRNKVAEWSRLGLETLPLTWLDNTLLQSNNDITNTNALIQIKNSFCFKIAEEIYKRKPKAEPNESNNDNNMEQIPSYPISQLLTLLRSQTLRDESRELSCDLDGEEITEVCLQCRNLLPYREMLKLSFDEENMTEDRNHIKEEKCTCKRSTLYGVSIGPIEEIHLSHNRLVSVDGFVKLSRDKISMLAQSVKRISLLDNQLREFPYDLSQVFLNLVDLNLSKNKLTNFPFSVLFSCSLLRTLDVSNNNITDDIIDANFSTIEILNIENSTASDEPSHHVHQLTTLKLNDNKLTNFPQWIFMLLPSLQYLDLKRNSIQKLKFTETTNKPLKQLIHLNINGNQIYVLPSTFLQTFPSIQHLDVSQNKLTHAEEQTTSDVTTLKYADLSKNYLENFPEFLKHQTRLQTLIFSRNNLSEHFSSLVWSAKRLSWLDVSHNNVVDVTMAIKSINSQWSSTLRVLKLSNNQVTVLPPVIGNLNKLEILDVSHNELMNLPNELGQLSSTLTQLSIEGNPLNLDSAILKGSTRDLCGFLFARLKRSVPNVRVKLMLIGDPRAGKTTLLQSLMRGRGRKRSVTIGSYSVGIGDKEPPILATVGVDVNEWKLKHGNKLYSVSAWDFAGQEDFYATHPCFLSERAMYVAVYDASKSVEQLRTLKPWLAAIHARASHCPVLIIGTHADLINKENKQDIVRNLNEELNMMSGCKWFPQGARKNNSILHEVLDVRESGPEVTRVKGIIFDVITEAVVKGHTLVGNMVPSSYVELQNLLKIEAGKRENFPVISFTELADIVHGCHTNIGFENGAELMLAVRYLHQTGALLHFNDPRSRLCDYFFVKPSWLCQMLAQIVTMKEHKSYKLQPFVNEKGILSKNLFSQHFLKQVGSEEHKSFLPRLFRLLEHFEVVLWQGGDSYLVPSQLPATKPSINLPIDEPSHKVIRYFSMVYVPMGFWSRLIGRLLAFADTILGGVAVKKSGAKSHESKVPCLVTTWKEGIYMQWDKHGHEIPFVLAQMGSKEFDETIGGKNTTSSKRSSLTFEHVNTSYYDATKEGIEVIVSHQRCGKILLGQLVDHISSLMQEWYPGLLDIDPRGCSLFQQFAPCPGCVGGEGGSPEVGKENTEKSVHAFFINKLAESITSHGRTRHISGNGSYDITIEDNQVMVRCPNHDQLVNSSSFAPEVNLDDYDDSLKLDVGLLTFEANTQSLLGDGGFGAVYQAIYDGRNIAAKTFHLSASTLPYIMLRNELTILGQNRHPSVVSLVGFVPPATTSMLQPLLGMEYASLGSLGNLLRDITRLDAKTREKALSRQLRHRILFEIADGLSFLHSRHIIYRDLKPDNVLLVSLNPDHPTVTTITDYGISTLASPTGIPGASGSPGYSAPEVVTLKVEGNKRDIELFPYSVKCDIYSFGLLMHEVAVGRSPWVDYVSEERISQMGTSLMPSLPDEIIMQGILPSPISSYSGSLVWPYAQQLVTECLRRNPDSRPTSDQLKQVFSNIQSCALKMVHSLHKPFVSCTVTAGSSRSNNLYEDNLLEIFYVETTPPSGESSSTIHRNTINIDRGKVLSEKVETEFPTNVISMVVVPGHMVGLESKPIFVGGTKEGEILVCFNDFVIKKKPLKRAITCLMLHQPYQGKIQPSTFLLVGTAEASVVVYSIKQLLNPKDPHPLHELNLAQLTKLSPVSSIISSRNEIVFVACANQVVSVAVSASGQPTIQATKVVGHMKSIEISYLALGRNNLYAATLGGSIVYWPLGGGMSKTSFDFKKVVSQMVDCDPTIMIMTSLFVDKHRSSIWVGTSTGHVIVFAEPLRPDDIIIPTTVLHRHTGAVYNIQMCKNPSNDCDVIICCGTGIRPIAEDWKNHQNKKSDIESTENFNEDVIHNATSYATIWVPEVLELTRSLKNAIKKRNEL